MDDLPFQRIWSTLAALPTLADHCITARALSGGFVCCSGEIHAFGKALGRARRKIAERLIEDSECSILERIKFELNGARAVSSCKRQRF